MDCGVLMIVLMTLCMCCVGVVDVLRVNGCVDDDVAYRVLFHS